MTGQRVELRVPIGGVGIHGALIFLVDSDRVRSLEERARIEQTLSMIIREFALSELKKVIDN